MPLLSLVVPVHGVQGYLRECLDSVLGQSFTDLEVIAVDDASPDQCGEILDRYAERPHRGRARKRAASRALRESEACLICVTPRRPDLRSPDHCVMRGPMAVRANLGNPVDDQKQSAASQPWRAAGVAGCPADLCCLRHLHRRFLEILLTRHTRIHANEPSHLSPRRCCRIGRCSGPGRTREPATWGWASCMPSWAATSSSAATTRS